MKIFPMLALSLFAVTMPKLVRASAENCAKALQNELWSDENLWLEDILGANSLAWVRTHNSETLAQLEGDSRFSSFQQAILKNLTGGDRIPYGKLRDGFVYNLWKDAKNIHGVWRRSSWKDYQKSKPQWEDLLDLDALSAAENENWVYKGAICLPINPDKCLIKLSRGGRDAVVVREFSVAAKKFVTGGFEIPESKLSVAWRDENTLIVASNWGEGSLTESGYPRNVKVWSRGTALKDAKPLFEVAPQDIAVTPTVFHRPEGNIEVYAQAKSYFRADYFVRVPSGELVKLPVPGDANLLGVVKGQLIFQLRSEWSMDQKGKPSYFPSGALVSFDYNEFVEKKVLQIQLVLVPTGGSSVEWVTESKNYIFVNLMENVQGRLVRIERKGLRWIVRDIDLPVAGTLELVSSSSFDDHLLVSYESFLTPERLLSIQGLKGRLVRSQQEKFNSQGMAVKQLWATSKDGVKVPYFVVSKEPLTLDGRNRTFVYGYGGFEASSIPTYSSMVGKLWLERGGVYVLANIRGGGEFGPAWHQAALKENRQKAFDDFIAIGEDLVARGITSPQYLGAMGGSNGGLLMGAIFTQRPDLFKAIVCQVPLLDMLRYHKLLAGASWVGEYGNPDIPEEAAYIAQYSPYQNLHPEWTYPRVFFNTSTNDDRVHPGHARKMAARMESMDKQVYYYENLNGGHGGAANDQERAHVTALEFIYLSRELDLP